MRTKEASAEDAVGVERGLIVFFGSIQVTTHPMKHWSAYLDLLSVLRRPGCIQALLPALEATHLEQSISTVTALQRWAFLLLQYALNCNLHKTSILYSLLPASVKNKLSEVIRAAKRARRGNGDRSVCCGL